MEEENVFLGETISGRAEESFDFCDTSIDDDLMTLYPEKRDIGSDLIAQIKSKDFYALHNVYTTVNQQKNINFDRYSRFQIVDWLFEIGKVTYDEKYDLYQYFFSKELFENERCLTCLYENLKEAKTRIEQTVTSNLLSSSSTTELSIYSTNHFDISYDSNDFLSTYIPSEVGQRFENIRSYFAGLGYLIPNPDGGYNRYQVILHTAPGPNEVAALTSSELEPMPNNGTRPVSHIDLYYVSTVMLDSKFNEVAAHEWFHALRKNYYWGSDWFDESFANWAGIIYDGDSEFSNRDIINFINADVSLDSRSHNYGACLFPMVLYKNFGGHVFIKELLTVLGTVSYQGTQKLIEGVNRASASLGVNKSFTDALRHMHSYNYLPNSWYNDACSTNTTRYWYNDDKTIYDLVPLGGYSENATERTVTYTNISVQRLGRKYLQFIPRDGKAYNVEFEIVFSGGEGYAQHHVWDSSDTIYIGFLNNVSNSTCWHFYGLGSHLSDAGIILTNASQAENCTCTITVRYSAIQENYTFKLYDRLFQRRFFLDRGDYAEYSIKFENSGKKIFQTVGPSDAKIELLTNSNVRLNNVSEDDDKGYSTNSFSTCYCSANDTVVVRVRFYNPSFTGFIKLLITNSDEVTSSDYGIQSFNDITEIVHDNFIFGTWCVRYKAKLLLYRPVTSGTVRITLSSIFDNYLYVIDPTSSSLNVDGLDFDDDSGNGTNASITRYMSSSHPYLIIYSQYDPSNNFINLDEGDDLSIHFERIY